MDKTKETIAAEHVHVGDWQNMVRLFVELSRRAHEFDGTHEALRERLTKRFESFRERLA